MKDILVLGGAGYLGSHIVKKLLIKGFNPIVIDNLTTGNVKNLIVKDFYQTDIADKFALNNIFKNHKIQAVIHLAVGSNTDESIRNPQKYYDNITTTLNVLNCMLANNVKNIIFASSGKIFGVPQYLPIDEKHPKRPITPTGKINFTIENILDDYDKAYNLKSICLRLFNVAGNDKTGKLKNYKNNLIKNALKTITGETDFLKIYGDGTTRRDYTHVEDVADVFVLALEKLLATKSSDKINISTGVSVSINEIIENISNITGKEIPVLYTPKREFDYKEISISNKYAQETLYWIPKYRNIKDIIISEL